ncbi:MAG: Coenzyme F420 hydrogenase/dehydrogenase, beta subunit C-terminal domain [Desulfobacteraceae bacterium]|nr:MAG: Coenzyme F420 hydrogenase/dehydrogenase, beta subunit C-terminal domain [Desulfobacteraceae bacterium]
MEDKDQTLGQKELQERVLDADLCTGCGACVGLCPYQVSYNDNTVILHHCDMNAGRCYAFCPRTPTDLETLRNTSFDEADLTPEIGAVKGFYITRATDEQTRKNAQHGGTVTALMALAMEEGIVDTAVIADARENFLPNGVSVKTPSEVKERGKSTFVVSPTVAEFNRIARDESNKIGVVATPCQALAIAKMRLKPIATDDNDIDKLSLVIGLFCGWAFSWRKVVDLLREKTDLNTITGMDIPPSKYHSIEVYTKNGTIEISLDDVNPCIREACRYCFDMTAEFSDISVGSARLPEDWEVARSWNQLIVRTQIGHELMELARSRGTLEFRDVPEENLDKLKKASMNKKSMAVKNLAEKSGSSGNLLYLDSRDPVLRTLFE